MGGIKYNKKKEEKKRKGTGTIPTQLVQYKINATRISKHDLGDALV